MTAFFDYIDKATIGSKELPSVHTTTCFRLDSIKSSGALEPQHCAVFNESLLYFFYGRPAYRDPSQTLPTREIGFYPICFVFKPDTVIKKAKRVFPFDTGASNIGLYQPLIEAGQLLDFELQTNILSAQKLVSCFFEDGEDYLSNIAKYDLSFSPSEGDAELYYQLINGGGDPRCDDRSSAVEIQVGEIVNLKQELLAVVLPTCFLDDKSLAATILDNWQATPLTYDADVGMRPIEFHGTIRHLIRNFYRRLELI